jgi:hypothetical protein
MSAARWGRMFGLALLLGAAALLAPRGLAAQSLVPERALAPLVSVEAAGECTAAVGCATALQLVERDRLWMAFGGMAGLGLGIAINHFACSETFCERGGLVFPLVGAIVGLSITHAVLQWRGRD